MASDQALDHQLYRNEFPHRDGKYFLEEKGIDTWEGQGGISSGFPLASLALPGSESVFGLFHGPPVCRGLPGGSDGKESACNAGDLGSIPDWGRSPGEEYGNPLQYSCLKKSMDRGAWQPTVHGTTEGQTGLSN